MISTIAHYLIFPGFAFMAGTGLVMAWVDRKLAARMQWRRGPVFLQPWYDLRKLFIKEIILPEKGNLFLFIVAPLAAVLSLVYTGTSMMLVWQHPDRGFSGDMFLYLYLLALPSLCLMLGGTASANPYAALGVSREMKLITSYEIPLVVALLVPALKAGSMSLGTIVQYQQVHGAIGLSVSGCIALIVMAVCMQAKMGLAPFDLSEAETELAGGVLVEYAGPLLALWKIARMMTMVILPLFTIGLFWANGPWYLQPLKYAIFMLVALSIRILVARVRIDHTIRFYWRSVVPLSMVALVAGLLGA